MKDECGRGKMKEERKWKVEDVLKQNLPFDQVPQPLHQPA